MRIATFAVLLAALCISTTAGAQELLCCGTKACPAGTTQLGDGQCCTDPGDPSTCAVVANLGKRCNDDPAAVVSDLPARNNIAGCAEVPGVACIGGEIGDDSGPVDGCVCVGDSCEADFDFPNGKPHCTAIAVDACCAAGACL
jgi:hypothetical protein